MKQRLITGIIAGAVFLGLCFIGGLWYHLLILAMALIGYYEFVRMTNTAPFGGTAWIGYVGVFLFVFPWGPLQLNFNIPWGHVLWLLLLLFMLVTVITKNTIDIKRVSLLFLASAYIGIGFSFIAESRHAPDGHGVFWTFLLLVSIWASDAGAYFVGRSMGRHKLWPSISPNKTVEGALGGVLIAVVTALLFAFFSDGFLTAGQAVLIGLSCAVIGQLGDLVQSAYKRVYGIKDSGKLLPGHGGILDRCDSWIVVFPFVHILGLLPY